MLRITHCNNIAGVGSTLVKYQKRLGAQSQLIVKVRHPNQYEYEITRDVHSGMLSLLTRDVIHYHYSTWYTSMFKIPNFDARLLRLLDKKIIMHYHGDDIRRGKQISVEFSHTFVSTPDLLEYSPESEWLPNPVDLEAFPHSEREPTRFHRVGYYDPPPESGYVPTRDIEAAVADLRNDGFAVETVPARGLLHNEMPRYYSSVTVWIDKLQAGAYSLMACEAAATGIPVIASTSRMRRYLNEHPFYEFSGDLRKDLRYLLEHDRERRRLAERGREYVQTRHDASRIAKRTLEVYKSIN